MSESGQVAPGGLARGGVAVVHERSVLGEMITDLTLKQYRMATLDCRRWETPIVAAQELAAALNLPVSMPRTLSVIGSWLVELARSEEPYGEPQLRLAVICGVFDDFVKRFRAEALTLVDELAQASRMAPLFEHRILVVVQSDDPDLRFEAVPTETIASKADFRLGLWPPPEMVER